MTIVITRFASTIRKDLAETRARFPTEYKRTWDAATYAATTFARACQNVKGFDHEEFMRACGLRENYPQQ